MQIIPLNNLSSQRFAVVLDGQYCTIDIYWRQRRFYLSLSVGDTLIRQGAICQNLVDVLQGPAPGFSGSLHFYDQLGDSAPEVGLLESRYLLLYAFAGELEG